MSKFVKLTLHDGRNVVWPIADIAELAEMSEEATSKAHRSGCIRVIVRDPNERDNAGEAWLIGTLDQNLAKIREAEGGAA